jgi:hypothetical protein
VLNIRKGTTKIENHMSANDHWWNNVLNIISKNISAQTGFELTIYDLVPRIQIMIVLYF